MVERVVDDVLADAVLARAAQVDDGAQAGEVARDVPLEPLELVRIDSIGRSASWSNRATRRSLRDGAPHYAETGAPGGAGTRASRRAPPLDRAGSASISTSTTSSSIVASTLTCGGTPWRDAP